MSRTRTRTSKVGASLFDTRTYCEDPSTTNNWTSNGYFNGVEEVTVDTVTPGYRRLIQDGRIINNYFKTTKTSMAYSPQSWNLDYTDPNCPTYTGWITQNSNSSYGAKLHDYVLSIIPDDTDTAISDAIRVASTGAAANVVRPDFMGLLELAEFNKTLKLLRSPILDLENQVLDAQRSWRKHNRRVTRSRRKSLRQFIADNWLKYRYGFTPLVLSSQELLELAFGEKKAPRLTARSSSSGESEASDVSDTVGASFDVTSTIQASNSFSVRAGVLYEHEFSVVQDSGLSLRELPSVAWELIPFSFVADWFVNVGDLIQAVTPKAGLNVLASWHTIQKEKISTLVWNGSLTNPAYTSSRAPAGRYVIHISEKERIPGLKVGLASKLHEINFERSIDWKRLADALSLINNTLGYR